MPIYKLEGKQIKALAPTTFANEKINEARDLQQFIINSIEVIDKDLLVISSEFGDWENSKRRIDILCIDKDANLVVIELKRTEDGGHMELQAIRYAAMIANMTFDKAVKAYSHYLKKRTLLDIEAEEVILNFLEWEEVNEDEFANDVRIILVSANFSKEITTSVIWLIEREIDIRCVRIRPQKDGTNLFFDIQQIIPLPETADYQVKLREKAAEQRQARRESKRDYSKFDLKINGILHENLNKRQTMFTVISHCVKSNISPEELELITRKGRWLKVEKDCNTIDEFENELINHPRKYDAKRWFSADDELLHFEGKTYLYSNQQGPRTFEIIQTIFDRYPHLNGEISKIEK